MTNCIFLPSQAAWTSFIRGVSLWEDFLHTNIEIEHLRVLFQLSKKTDLDFYSMYLFVIFYVSYVCLLGVNTAPCMMMMLVNCNISIIIFVTQTKNIFGHHGTKNVHTRGAKYKQRTNAFCTFINKN